MCWRQHRLFNFENYLDAMVFVLVFWFRVCTMLNLAEQLCHAPATEIEALCICCRSVHTTRAAKMIHNTADPVELQTRVKPISSCFSKPGTYITHNASLPLSDIFGGIYQITCIFLWSHKRLYTTVFTLKFKMVELPFKDHPLPERK